MSTQAIIDHRFQQPQFDPSTAQVVAFVYCELCRMPFTTSRDEALHPGKYMSTWRELNHRPPIVCDECHANPHRFELPDQKMVSTMLQVAREISASRQVKEAMDADRTRFHKPREVFHSPKPTESHMRARRQWAKWRIPLMQALQEKQELTAKMICFYVTGRMDVNSQEAGAVVCKARAAGIPLVVVRQDKVETVRGMQRRNWYGLSSKPIEELDPIAQEQDPETGKFVHVTGEHMAWLAPLKAAFAEQGELTVADMHRITGLTHQRIASYVASILPVVVSRREYRTDGYQTGVHKTTYYKLAEVVH